MDQFTITIGDTIYLDTHTDKVQCFKGLNLNLIVGVSGLSKDTYGTLSQLKSNAWKAIHQVKSQKPNFDIALSKVTDLKENIKYVETDLKPYFYAAICNHDITKRALKILQQESLNIHVLGELMNEHHLLLKSYLKITTPLIDKMIDAANNNGALGSKIVGSGGGGCIIAIAQKQKQKQIIEAIKATGAADAFEVNITKGASLN
jgi:galactokinase